MTNFRKYLICFLSFLFIFSTVSAQDDNFAKGYKYATVNTVYLQYDAWSFFGPNLKIVSERNPTGVYMGTEEFKNYIKKIPASYKLYAEYESKLMLSNIIIIGGTLASTGLVYVGVGSFSSSTDTGWYMMGGFFILYFASIYVGSAFRLEALNSFYKSLNEYNKAIVTAGFRQAGMPAIQYNLPF